MRLLLALIALLTLAAPSAAAAQERSYVYERVAVMVDVGADGVLSVSETYTYRFSGGPFRRALRGIAYDRLDRIEGVSLSEGGREYARANGGEEPGTFTVQDLYDELLVSWFYEPAADETRSFTLRYTVHGAVRVDPEADEIWWVAVFPERDVPVEQSSVTMRFPQGFDLKPTSATMPAERGDLLVEPREVSLIRNAPLEPGEALELRVDFAPGLIDSPVPGWQAALDAPAPSSAARQRPPKADGGWLIFLLFGLVMAGTIFWRLINGEPIFGSPDGDDGGYSSGRRSSGWSSRRSSASSSFSSRRSSSSSSRRSSSSRGGSGGGRGGAG